MIAGALHAHADRIDQVAETTAEAIKVARSNQIAIARIEERLVPLDKGIGEIRDSVRSLTDAIEAGDARLIIRDHEHRIAAIREEFHECRRASRRARAWLLGILAAAIVGALGYFGDLLFRTLFTSGP